MPVSTATARFHDTPSTPVAVLVSSDLALLPTPVFAEPLFVFATPNWAPLSFGLTDPQGDYTQALSIPAVPALQYRSVWLTGAFLGALPFRSTAPLGGVIL